jgi:hypothetical protein
MAGTMVEEGHAVKPLPDLPLADKDKNQRQNKYMRIPTRLPHAHLRIGDTNPLDPLFGAWGLTQS